MSSVSEREGPEHGEEGSWTVYRHPKRGWLLPADRTELAAAKANGWALYELVPLSALTQDRATPDRLQEIHDLASANQRPLGEALDMPEGKRRVAALERQALHAHEAFTAIIHTTKLEEPKRVGRWTG